jgi:uncharacterized protein YceK
MRNKHPRIITTALTITLITILGGCGSVKGNDTGNTYWGRKQGFYECVDATETSLQTCKTKINNHETICVLYSGNDSRRVAMSCDWERTK